MLEYRRRQQVFPQNQVFSRIWSDQQSVAFAIAIYHTAETSNGLSYIAVSLQNNTADMMR